VATETSYEDCQYMARTRYKRDAPGALKRAIETQFGAGAAQGRTEFIGLAGRAADLLGGANTGKRMKQAFPAAGFVLTFAPAP